ncbi:STAS domain-containing protein [Actinoplanes sp. G11-F43]|uniref:STAS domain-containing protein n=1 Tax=Actinoplanes sp. G11-F43 TaxID=3424130 RepID=UPI003D3534DC
MSASTVDVSSTPDGTLVIHPHGDLDADDAIGLRRALVHAIRHTRPLCLVLDLADVHDLDPLNLGALAAACGVGDDHQVAVFVDNSSAALAVRLTQAGVPEHRLRNVA